MKLIKIISEIKQLPRSLKVGQTYDVKIWLPGEDIENQKPGEHLEPAEGTVWKKPGDYWVLDMIYKGIRDGFYYFEDDMDSFQLNVDPDDIEDVVRDAKF